jgi:hypothetical protein
VGVLGKHREIRAALRQLRFPASFRIPAVLWPEAALETLDELAKSASSAAVLHREGPETTSAERMSLLADVATGLWRLRQKMLEPGAERPLPEMRRAYRHLQSVWDVLSDAGIEICDYTGMNFDSGMSLNVVAHQPAATAERERIIETVKPSIYFKSQRIQLGDVIVETPIIESGAAANPSGS